MAFRSGALRSGTLSRSVILAMFVTLGLAACGKEGPPEPPEGEPITYPRSYPTR